MTDDHTFSPAPGSAFRSHETSSDFSATLGGDRNPDLEIALQLLQWQKFLAEEFTNISIDLYHYSIPKMRPGFDWIMPDIPDALVTTQAVLDRCGSYFRFDSDFRTQNNYDQSIEEVLVRHRYDGLGVPRILRVRNMQESYTQYRSRSIGNIQDIHLMTLKQCLLLELWCWKTTGNLREEGGVTLCAGTRSIGCCLPVVCWDSSGALDIKWWGPDGFYGYMGVREVVSCSA